MGKLALINILIFLFVPIADAGWVSCVNSQYASCQGSGGTPNFLVCDDFSDGEACVSCTNIPPDGTSQLNGCGGPDYASAPITTTQDQCEQDDAKGNYSTSIQLAPGVEFNYDSSRTVGKLANSTLNYTFLDTVPTFFSSYTVTITIAGRTETWSQSASEPTVNYVWDGLDVNGVPAKGLQIMVGSISALGQTISQSFIVGTPDISEDGSDVWEIANKVRRSEDSNIISKSGGSDIKVESTTAFNKHLRNNETAAFDPEENKVYIFDQNNRHVRSLNSLTGAVTNTFTYYPNGLMEKSIDAYGAETTYIRDAQGNLTSIVNPDGLITTVTTQNGKIMSFTSPAGETTSMTYHPNGMLASKTLPTGKTTNYIIDTEGNLIGTTESGGSFYNFANVPTIEDLIKKERTSAEGRVQTTWYFRSPTSSGTQTESPLGVKTIVGEEQGNNGGFLWQRGDATRVVEFQDDVRFGTLKKSIQNTTVTQDNRSNVTNVSYNVSLSDPLDPFSIQTMTETHDSNGRVTTKTYDGVNKTWTTTSPEGRSEVTAIDQFEKPLSVQQGNFTPMSYTYDTRGRLQQESQGNRNTNYVFNTEGYISQVTNSLNETTSYTYDDDGKVETMTLADNRVMNVLYNTNGDLLEITPAGKPKHSFVYNAFDLIQEYLPPVLGGSPTPTNYVYNLDQELIRVDRPDGTSIDYNRDSTLGVLSSVSVGGQNIYAYIYSSKNGKVDTSSSKYNITSDLDYKGDLVREEKWSITSTQDQIAKSSFNFNDNFERTKWSVQGAINQPTRNLWFTYDQDGLITKAGPKAFYTYGTNDPLIRDITMGLTNEQFSYNSFGELDGKTVTSNGQVVYSLSYTRDDLGRVDTKTETRQGSSHTYDYSYDVSGRLLEVKKDGVIISSYNYDDNNNRINGLVGGQSFIATYDDQDRLLSYNDYTYTYNDNGERTSKTNTQTNKTETYTYNKLGQLESVTIPSGDVVSYLYDGMGRRTTRLFNGNPTTFYVFDGEKIVAEVRPSDGALIKRFIYVSDDHSPDYMIRWSKTYRFIKDHLGSIVMTLDESTGQVFQEIEYDEFGQVIAEDKKWLHPFRFAGGVYETRTKLTRFGVRDYDAQVGRWTTKDPIRFDGGTGNLYGYVLQDPINMIDPFGLAAICKRKLHEYTGIKLEGQPFDFLDLETLHEHIFYEDGSDSGYYQDGFGEGENKDDFQCSPERYDDERLKRAERKVRLKNRFRNNNYNPYSNNCQDYISDVLRNY